MRTYNRGSVFYILAEVFKYAPFGNSSLYDPTEVRITISDPTGADIISEELFEKTSIGRYYYICQTEENWEAGVYKTKTITKDGVLTDITIDESGFHLI